MTENFVTTDAITPSSHIPYTEPIYGYNEPDITLPAIIEPENDKYKDTLLPEEIEYCVNKVTNGFDIDGFEYDIDFDGNKELLVPVFALLKIFKKTDNVIC